MHNSKVLLGKKKKNGIKEEDKLMNEKAHDEWEEAVSVYNLYNAGLCISQQSVNLEDGTIRLDMPSFPKKHCCLFTT